MKVKIAKKINELRSELMKMRVRTLFLAMVIFIMVVDLTILALQFFAISVFKVNDARYSLKALPHATEKTPSYILLCRSSS